jgi:hypothetical protein
MMQRGVPRQQDPKLEVRTDVRRPFWFIRPYVAVRNSKGDVIRRQTRVRLGYVDKMSLRQANSARRQYLAAVNAGLKPD